MERNWSSCPNRNPNAQDKSGLKLSEYKYAENRFEVRILNLV